MATQLSSGRGGAQKDLERGRSGLSRAMQDRSPESTRSTGPSCKGQRQKAAYRAPSIGTEAEGVGKA